MCGKDNLSADRAGREVQLPRYHSIGTGATVGTRPSLGRDSIGGDGRPFLGHNER